MPRVKRVESLFEISIDFITENMDTFCKEISTLGEVDAVSLEGSTNVFNLLREFCSKYYPISLQFMYFKFFGLCQLSSFLFYRRNHQGSWRKGVFEETIP
jgi:hypothetical protein